MPRLPAIRLALLMLFALAPTAHGQLLSPGKLIASHGDLDGVRNCTRCHQLGERGVANAKCLDCHEPLAERIARREGFHATIGTKNCGECHKDHFGADFDAVHFDTAGFDHHATGFDLTGGHARAACRDCHRPEYVVDAAVRQAAAEHGRLATTYLGLATTCVGCHRDDDPHAGQFPNQGCAACHSEADWKKPDRFDHGKTRYPLRGRHVDVACRECHAPIPGHKGALKLTGLEFATCAGCHQKDDPHAGQFAGRRCEECHSEAGWKSLGRFDHSATRYPLTGRHVDVECTKCHTPLPRRQGALRLTGLEFGTCLACHENDDPHGGRLGITCNDCHTTAGWRATGGTDFERTFDHSRTRFALRGKHATVACAECHDPRRPRDKNIALTFAAETRTRTYPLPAASQCTSCHVDYHAGMFANSPGGSECKSCHGEDGWLPTSYDIARHNRDARYQLTGAHRAAPCVACHKSAAAGRQPPAFRIAEQDCAACHRANDPHGDQFPGRACDTCHDTRSFRIAAFDHSKTRYALDGAHRKVACVACHPLVTGPGGKSMRRYRPLGMTCRDCHDGDRS
jgi:hypothetical protein